MTGHSTRHGSAVVSLVKTKPGACKYDRTFNTTRQYSCVTCEDEAWSV